MSILRSRIRAVDRLQAVSFDLDDTLWDIAPVITRAEHVMYGFLRDNYPRVTQCHSLESMRDRRAQIALERPEMRHDFSWLRLEALRMHATEAGYPESMAGDAFEVFFAARNEVRLHEDVVPALDWLRSRRLRLFVITNGNADLERIGIAAYFEQVVHARVAGALKPDPAIFSGLLAAAGLDPPAIAHVGDDPHADMRGARAAGMRTVWLNRRGAPWPADETDPDHMIGSLSELAGLPTFA